MGTPDVGTASAGMASRASDAATAFANPAGMTRLTESQLMVGVQPLYADIQFDTRSSTFGGGDGGNAGGLVPTGSLSYVNNSTDRLKLGLTAGSYLGLGNKFDDDWAVSAGFACCSSPFRNANRSIVLPLDRQYRYGLGLTYDWRKNITFGAACEYMDAGSAPVNRTGGDMKGDLKGRFRDDAFSILALSMIWKF
jgi:long-chain fatty acid transport protein